MTEMPLSLAFRLWFQANLFNSCIMFFIILFDEGGFALLAFFLILVVGLFFTVLLLPFIHYLNKFVMQMEYAFWKRFVTLQFFQCLLAFLFWACFFWIGRIDWMHQDEMFRYMMSSSIFSVLVAVLLNKSRFRNLEATGVNDITNESQ